MENVPLFTYKTIFACKRRRWPAPAEIIPDLRGGRAQSVGERRYRGEERWHFLTTAPQK